MITVAAPNVIPKLMMSKVSDILTSFDLTINGVHVDTIKTHENSSHSEPGHADLALVRFQVDELNRSSRGKCSSAPSIDGLPRSSVFENISFVN